jgi:hypothetical protein
MGNFVCCQSQAVLNALARSGKSLPLSVFEIATTLVFGIRHVPQDNYRLIDSILAPTTGLHRALQAFAIPYRYRNWEKETDSSVPLAQLRKWLNHGPVVLGSLRMDRLPYLLHSFIYAGIGHCITVFEGHDSHFVAADPLGFYPAILTEDELVAAWRGDGVKESIGEFEMWCLTGPPERRDTREVWAGILKRACANLALAESEPLGGSSGLAAISGYAEEEFRHFRNGIVFALKCRLQRSYLVYEFLHALKKWQITNRIDGWFESTARLLMAQMDLLAAQLAGMDSDKNRGLAMFTSVAECERHISEAFFELGEVS